MRLARKFPTVAEPAFKKTTVREIAMMVAGAASGKRMIKIGTRMNPPPSPTIVPKAATAAPKSGNSSRWVIVRSKDILPLRLDYLRVLRSGLTGHGIGATTAAFIPAPAPSRRYAPFTGRASVIPGKDKATRCPRRPTHEAHAPDSQDCASSSNTGRHWRILLGNPRTPET